MVITEVRVSPSTEEIAQEEFKELEQQRVLGIVPNALSIGYGAYEVRQEITSAPHAGAISVEEVSFLEAFKGELSFPDGDLGLLGS
jgi:heme oxygenase